MASAHVPAPVAALVLGVLLTGCASASQDAPPATSGSTAPAPAPAPSGTDGSSTSSPSSPPAAPAQDAPRTLEVSVTGTTVDPAPAQVDLAVGELLRLVVTADDGAEVHAHGFAGATVPVTPGEPTTVDLRGDVPGVYEVELHDPDLLLLQVAVR